MRSLILVFGGISTLGLASVHATYAKPMGNLPDRPKRTFNSSIRNGSSLREFTGRARRALHFQMGGALALAAQPGAGFTSELPEICEYRAKLTELMQRSAVFSPTAKRCSCHFENASLSGRFIASCIGILPDRLSPACVPHTISLDSIQVISRSFGPVQIGLPDCLKAMPAFSHWP
jgi:hypothetical protein